MNHPPVKTEPGAPLVWGEPRARWVVAATVLGSALTFVDATVVNIALPHVGRDLEAGTSALTWVVNGYTLTLAAFVLLGGSLGDRFGRRRVFSIGVGVFAAASLVCGVAPDVATLITARAVQGVGAALLMPGSLAILQASFAHDDRAKAIGAWSGFAGMAGAIGPLAGGWLVEVANWRWVFLINLPLAGVVLLVTGRHVPESRDPDALRHIDVPGALLLAACLGSVTYGLTAAAGRPFLSTSVGAPLVAGLFLGAVFLAQEHRSPAPLLSLSVFSSRLFSATNAVTFLVYAALAVVFFSLGVVLQVGAGYSPLAAGLSLLPLTVLMLLFSARSGALMNRTGPRLPLVVGPVVAAIGVALLSRVDADTNYFADVFGPVVLLGIGLTVLVTPLTATVLGSVPDHQAGLASGVNNAVARTAGLLGVAALPVVAGLNGSGLVDQEQVLAGFPTLAWSSAGLLLAAAGLAAVTITGGDASRPRAAAPAKRHCSLSSPPVPVGSE